MKRYISLIVALVLVIMGIIGTMACLSSSRMKESSVIDKYINAIDNGKMEKMMKYTVMSGYSDALSSVLGSSSDELLQMSGISTKEGIGACLYLSGLNAQSKVPADAKEIKGVELVCYNKVKEENESFSVEDLLGLSGSAKVNAVVKVIYVDAEGKKASFMSDESFYLVKNSLFGYKISSIS